MGAWAAASRDTAERKALKSPPHCAAPAGAAKNRVQNRIAVDRNSMLLLNLPQSWESSHGEIGGPKG